MIADHFQSLIFHGSERLQIGFYAGGIEEEEQCENSSGGLPTTVCLYGCSYQCSSWIPYAYIREDFCGPGTKPSRTKACPYQDTRGSDFMLIKMV